MASVHPMVSGKVISVSVGDHREDIWSYFPCTAILKQKYFTARILATVVTITNTKQSFSSYLCTWQDNSVNL